MNKNKMNEMTEEELEQIAGGAHAVTAQMQEVPASVRRRGFLNLIFSNFNGFPRFLSFRSAEMRINNGKTMQSKDKNLHDL